MVEVEITFSNPQSPEYQAAEQLKSFFDGVFTKNEKGRILIASNVVCYGQNPKDVDLVVFGELKHVARKVWSKAIARRNNKECEEEEYSSKYVNLENFCLAVEVKDHRPNDIKVESQRLMVSYSGRNERIWHDATYQSEKQKYSVASFLDQHIHWNPWVCNFIWLRNVDAEHLPKLPDNLWPATLNFDQIFQQICGQRIPLAIWSNGEKFYSLSVGKSEGHETFNNLERAFNFFTYVEKNLGRLTREKLERITKSALLKDQKYAKSIGERLVIIRGRPGTGKTIKLLHIAHDLCSRHGERCLILTYNKALVSDLRRMIALARISNDIATATMDIKTIHSFIRTLLIGFELFDPDSEDGGNYLQNYENLKDQLLSYLQVGAISTSDIQDLMIQQHGEVAWDFILVDEGQDWPDDEKDILYGIFHPSKFIIADGMTQLIRTPNQTNWTAGVEYHKPIIAEKTSLRQKANLCRFVELFAEKSAIPWDVKPRDDLPGGKIIILAKELAIGYEHSLHQTLYKECDEAGNKPYEMMFLVPPNMVVRKGKDNRNFKFLKEYQNWGVKIWDGTASDVRSEYPTDVEEYRFLQYDSCRGLEGWSVMCLWLDDFIKYKMETYEHGLGDQRMLGLYGAEEEKRIYAYRWSLIALTRAIDTIVISLRNPKSEVGEKLKAISEICPDFVEWID